MLKKVFKKGLAKLNRPRVPWKHVGLLTCSGDIS